MKLIHALEEIPNRSTPIVLAAGCFDGLHLGHRAVIQVAIDRARSCAGETWVFTFSPHPAQVLDPEHAPPLICTPDQQLSLLQEMGVDGVILLPFTPQFIQQEPLPFFDTLCRHIPKLAGISVGESWSFGKNRSGTPTLLKKICRAQNIFFSAHTPICWKGERISSTRIRKAVQLGHLSEVRSMLGRSASTIGFVVQGEKIGRTLGYPTANIMPQNEMLPPRGIYAGHLRVDQTRYDAAAYIGHRETFHKNKPQILEVHLLNETDINLYGKQVEVSYLQPIRADQIFDTPERLKEQIKLDLVVIRAILSTYEERLLEEN